MVGVGEFHEFDGRAVFDDEGYADAGAFRSGQWSEIRDQGSGISGQGSGDSGHSACLGSRAGALMGRCSSFL